MLKRVLKCESWLGWRHPSICGDRARSCASNGQTCGEMRIPAVLDEPSARLRVSNAQTCGEMRMPAGLADLSARLHFAIYYNNTNKAANLRK